MQNADDLDAFGYLSVHEQIATEAWSHGSTWPGVVSSWSPVVHRPAAWLRSRALPLERDGLDRLVKSSVTH